MMTAQDWLFLDMARSAAQQSKDPSTKTGAVIAFDDRLVATGFNRFAPGVAETEERLNDRDAKYDFVLHCEVEAILTALNAGTWLCGATLYTWPFQSCSRCAGVVVKAGIKRAVAPTFRDDEKLARWGKSFERARQQFHEAGVRLDLLELT